MAAQQARRHGGAPRRKVGTEAWEYVYVCVWVSEAKTKVLILFSFFVVCFPVGKVKSYQFRDRGARFTPTQTSEKA